MPAFIAILISAVFIPGIILRVKSIASGRKGPGLLQPVWNFLLLLRKGRVYSTSGSIITRLAPPVALSAVICVALFIPFDGFHALISFSGDFVFFAYMLALGKFFMIVAALDTGSSFEGMGANREALYSMLIEPAFFIVAGSLALFTGHTSIQDIFGNVLFGDYAGIVAGLFVFYIIIQIAMIENSRMPVDDPKTHLELTMIHEVMVLDYSGFDLALIQLASSIKFAVYGALIAVTLIPSGWNLALQIAGFFFIQFIYAVIIGVLESFRARKRMKHNPQFILTISAISVVVLVIVLIVTKSFLQ